MLNWLILAAAIVAEVIGTTCLKMSGGLSRFWPVTGMIVFYGASFVGLALALRSIDMSVAYAIWSGLGVALITVVGVFGFGEAFTIARAVCIVLILLGVIGLNLAQS
ncbi:multidrug efflux SMR transporter [Salinisphaera sp. SPP-AMP-43]|uniref:DMT family transporter n=1 Tax=Salinisphaera sp. SPP-AMP-43 TaxID=3121288 RepID=UPI003C6DDA2D